MKFIKAYYKRQVPTSNMSENTVAKTTQSVTDNDGWINKWH